MKGWLVRILPPVAVFLGSMLLAEGIIRGFRVPTWLVPLPSEVLRALGEQRATLAGGLWTTGKAALAGFAASAVLGVLTAIALSASRLVQRAFYPYTVFFQTVPIVAIAPLLAIWFGTGFRAVAVSAFIVSVFPVIANTLTGLLSTDPALRDMFRLYGASRVATLWKLRLPAALPNIITGLRIAAGLAVIGAIVGEFVAGVIEGDGAAGLGVQVLQAQKSSPAGVFAAVLVASALGLILFAAINGLGWLLLRKWHASEQPV